MNTFLGIMRSDRFKDGKLYDRWFIHFPFVSSYEGEADNSKWFKDYWWAFWDLPNVSYTDMVKKGFEKPVHWDFLQYFREIQTTGLHLCRWTHRSPFFRDESWQRLPPAAFLRHGQIMM